MCVFRYHILLIKTNMIKIKKIVYFISYSLVSRTCQSTLSRRIKTLRGSRDFVRSQKSSTILSTLLLINLQNNLDPVTLRGTVL